VSLRFFTFFASRRKTSFLFSILAMFLLILILFLFGSFIDSQLLSWWVSLLILLGVLPIVGLSFVYEYLYYLSKPSIVVLRQKIGRVSLYLFSILFSSLIVFLIVLPFYLTDRGSTLSSGSFAPLGLCFSALIILTIACIGGGLKDLSDRGSTTVPSGAKALAFANKVNRFMAIFLISYFLLIAAPYCFALVPKINVFFTNTATKVLYRGFTCLYFFAYSFLLMKANKLRINISWAVILIVMAAIYLVAWMIVPLSYQYYSETFERGVIFYSMNIGQLWVLEGFLTFLAEEAIFLCIISFFPFCVKDRKAVIWPLVAVVALVAFSCLFSYLKEMDLYKALIRGDDETSSNPLRSIFHSKNAFGIFLFNGSFASLFLIYYAKKCRWVFGISYFLFLVTSALIRCYTALVPSLLIGIILLFTLLFRLKDRHPWLFLSILGTVGVLFLITVIGAAVPDIRSHFSIFNLIYSNVDAIFTKEITSRTKLWDYCLSLVKGPFVLIGETDVVASNQLVMIEQMVGDSSYSDFHSAFVSFYSSHGLIGLCAYVGMHAYALKGIGRIKAANRNLWIAVTVLFVGAVLFSMPETYTLFINMSASVFIITLVLLVYPRFISEENGGSAIAPLGNKDLDFPKKAVQHE